MSFNARGARPPYPASMIDRPRLYQHLDRWPEQRAIVIHAPTGYGKSSLVSRWIDYAGHDTRSAWLSLTESDSNPHEFALRLAAALDRIVPGALALVQPILEDGRGTIERVLTRLFSTFWDESRHDALPADAHLLLVLDDLHRVQSAEVDAAILMILTQGPPNLHLILLARRRTSLPLARLYAQGKIIAFSGKDLQFTSEEVRDFLQKHGFDHPTEAELAQLVTRSEGWVTALRLAVLAAQGRGSIGNLVRLLHGSNDWLADYLVDEVLNQQTPPLRQFLLQTSILDEFNARLCAAVTGDGAAHARLDEVVRGGLFLIPLPAGEGWFRYHHLFQELLQHRLQARTEANLVAELHRRAAAWLAGAGDVPAAVGHLLAAGDNDQAAALVESQMPDLLLHAPYRARTLLALLPSDVLTQRPQLMLDRCRLALLFDDEQAPAYAREAENTLRDQQATNPHAVRHHAEWLVLRAGSSFLEHDLAAMADYAQQAESYLPHLDDFHAGSLRFVHMLIHAFAGRHEEMVQSAEAALIAFARAGFTAGSVALRRELARWLMLAGKSREATDRFRELSDVWDRDRPLAINELAIAWFYAAENSYWQNQLEYAQVYQQRCMVLAEQLQDPQLSLLARYLGQALGMDAAAANVGINEFLDHLSQITSPAYVGFVLDCRTRFLIAAGQSDAAWRIFQERGITPENRPNDPALTGLIAFLRAAIAHGAGLEAITPTLAEALEATQGCHDRFRHLQLLALTAWQQVKLHGATAARETVQHALELARETGYVRVLLDIPELTTAQWFDDEAGEVSAAVEDPVLTEREQAVLTLLAEDYTYAQIGQELVISISTVRTHVGHIYKKLAVHRRNQAIRRARELGFI